MTISDQTTVPDRTSFADSLDARLFRPVSIDWLVFYRIAFGLVMFSFAVKYLQYGMVDLFYVKPIYHFPYDGFEWVRKLDMTIMVGDQIVHAIHLEFMALAAFALMIAVGFWYRGASILFAICFVHIFLIDKCYYQNHYYFVALLSLILPFLPAQRACSIDALLDRGIRSQTTPAWTLWLMRFQIGVPYFFGGIAKLNADWIRGQPMRGALAGKTDLPLIGPWFTEEWIVQSFVWGGLLFDLFIVPALLWKRTRIAAFGCCLVFHGMNSIVWTIGIFPWLMILATTVFFEPDWPRRVWSRVTRRNRRPVEVPSVRLPSLPVRRFVMVALGLYMTWQILFPLRQFVMPGNPNWDEYTHYFSWHMLLRAKDSGLRVYATDVRTQRTGTIDLRLYVTARQLGVIGRDPRMIYQLCRHIGDDLEQKGFKDVEVRVLALVSMNGRRPQPIIDPAVDLAHTHPPSSLPEWIVPLHEPFQHDAWDYPLNEWETRLKLDLPPQMKISQNR
ncbi:Vitamin K-dependent gamma-carboxylase [Gimesia panareensis]|uniref:Vitamin K-dependent gamma-carboxylase n=1 Tax=Gimesia panareensis TaxID=2527978 RepID=A0A518FLS7_9PLAN|nr:HTTM domain-containing protein [Gimesia panareensis]QDV17311.1 Vitamin K-dependent gamma-carboxylase [Gimesia panareensis]